MAQTNTHDEKRGPSDHTVEIQDATTITSQEQWKPGFWAQFPWLAAAALTGAIFMSIVAVIVLLLSDGKSVTRWDNRIAPNVILSVLNGISSACIAYAVGQGIAIVWWRKALRGDTIQKLSVTWSFGASSTAFFSNVKFLNIAALTALVTKLTIIDGVLFQRSTSTYIKLGPQHTQNVTTFPTNELPQTGRFNIYHNASDLLTYAFDWDILTWLSSSDGHIGSTNGFGECEGVCAVNISYPGYMIFCGATSEDVDLVNNATISSTRLTTHDIVETEIFGVSFNLTRPTAEKNYTWIGLNMTSYQRREVANGDNVSCPGTITRQQCELRQAMINYPVFIQFTNISTKTKSNVISNVDVYLGYMSKDYTLQSMDEYGFNHELGQIDGFRADGHPQWVEGDNLFETNDGLLFTANGGVALAMEDHYSAHAYVSSNITDGGWMQSVDGEFANTLTDFEEGVALSGAECPWQFIEPTWSIMLGLNTLTFIAADDLWNRKAHVWANTSIDDPTWWNQSSQQVPVIMHRNEIHYQTNLGWMFGALASTIVCVLLVLPAYWRFWELGRKVSFNPMEIAAAFQAPVLQSTHPTSGSADDIVEVAKSQQVRYVDLEGGSGGSKLRFVSA